jgi:hypothetical protein
MFPDRYTDPMAWYIAAAARTRAPSRPRRRWPPSATCSVPPPGRHALLRHRRGLAVRAVQQGPRGPPARVRHRPRRRPQGQGLVAGARPAEARRRRRRHVPGVGQGPLPPEAARAPRHHQHPRRRAQAPAAQAPDAEAPLRALFDQHRLDLKLFAYGCDAVTPDEFVEVYPLLPGQIDLILQITSALRTRSNRAQGDDQAIRGLLQLLGELFRDQALADRPVGSLITLDQIYEVQHTALDSDVQASMARVLSQCADEPNGLMLRAAKAVALLELIQDAMPTDAKLVAQCLYDRMDLGNNVHRRDRSARGAPAQEPARVLREGRLQAAVVGRRGVGARAPRHRRAAREPSARWCRPACASWWPSPSAHASRRRPSPGPPTSRTGAAWTT